MKLLAKRRVKCALTFSGQSFSDHTDFSAAKKIWEFANLTNLNKVSSFFQNV